MLLAISHQHPLQNSPGDELKRLVYFTIIFAALYVLAVPPRFAYAHPHVFVTMETDVIYGPDKSITGFKQKWTFDEMYSSFATYGLDTNNDGKFDVAELQSLADINIQSLKEFDYFTFPRVGNRKLAVQPPRDYWLEFRGELLTLYFTSDLAEPLTSSQQADFAFSIYDRVNYIAFKFAADAPVKLVGAGRDCASVISRPDAALSSPTVLSETYFQTLDPSADIGAQFAPSVRVACGERALAAAQEAEKAAQNDLKTAQSEEAQVTAAQAPPPKETAVTPPDSAPAPNAAASSPQPVATGLLGWVQQTQSYLNGRVGGAIRELKQQNPVLAGFTLAFFSFIYGVVHAAGPGHGKAIISSYVLANERTLRRGVILAMLASLAQAISAIALVGILVVAMRTANIRLETAVGNLETFSFAMVAMIGLWMLAGAVRRGWPAFAAPQMQSLSAAAVPLAVQRAAQPHAHHVHTHGADCGCGHSHAPDPSQLEGDLSWRKAAAIILAIGLRPCTGAILVLVFALSQGLLWAGVASTFAMAAGTAITVSTLAVLAVGSRNLAVRLTGGGGIVARRIEAGAAIGGALFLVIAGAVFFLASLGPAIPFAF